MIDNEVATAKRLLADAEREALYKPEASQAYTAVANAWIRLAELKTAQSGVRAFQEKRFN